MIDPKPDALDEAIPAARVNSGERHDAAVAIRRLGRKRVPVVDVSVLVVLCVLALGHGGSRRKGCPWASLEHVSKRFIARQVWLS